MSRVTLKSADGEEFTITLKAATLSATIDAMITSLKIDGENLTPHTAIPIPKVEVAILKKFCRGVLYSYRVKVVCRGVNTINMILRVLKPMTGYSQIYPNCVVLGRFKQSVLRVSTRSQYNNGSAYSTN